LRTFKIKNLDKKMKKRDELQVTQYIDRRLIMRLRIYIVVMLVMSAVIVFEVLKGTFSIPLAVGGILIGLGVGTIVSRMYRLSWDEETNNVIGRIDWIGAVILVCYLIFIFTRTHFLGEWVQGAPLLTIILSITAGTMLGRVMSTEHGIGKILKALKISGN
jgi:uncharacterized membrane protein